MHLAISLTNVALFGPVGAPPVGGGAGPTFIGAANVGPSSGTAICSKPTGTLDGHVMTMALHVDRTTSTVTLPSGWTLIDSVTFASQWLNTYYKVASGEGASYTITSSPSAFLNVAIVTYAGVDTTNPVQTHTINTNSSTMATALGLTTTNANTPLIMVASTTGTRSYTASSLTERTDDANNLGSFSDVQTAAGASGDKTATISSSATWATQLIALRPTGGV